MEDEESARCGRGRRIGIKRIRIICIRLELTRLSLKGHRVSSDAASPSTNGGPIGRLEGILEATKAKGSCFGRGKADETRDGCSTQRKLEHRGSSSVMACARIQLGLGIHDDE